MMAGPWKPMPAPPCRWPSRAGIHLRVPAAIEELTPYVLLEQEDWFEDEIQFVRAC